MANKRFKKLIRLYSILIFILVCLFSMYVLKILIDYEKNQTGTFISSAIKDLSDDTLKNYLTTAKISTDELDNYKKLVKSDDMKYEKGEDNNTFIATLNNRKMFTIKTKVVKDVTKLAIFSYQIQEVESIKPELSRGLIYYDVIAPSNFTIYINGEKFKGKSSKEEKYAELDFMYYKDLMPVLSTYHIDNLSSEAKITVKDFLDKEVELTIKDNVYKVKDTIYKVDSLDNVKKYINDIPDVLDIAKNWSKYLSKDLTGPYYGFTNIISKYVIDGTMMYERAYKWSRNIDITFISKHILKDPAFSNESIKNCTVYDSDSFSCEVYLEKNMLVGTARTPQTDVMHDYLYFLRVNNEWKLMNIKGADTDE